MKRGQQTDKDMISLFFYLTTTTKTETESGFKPRQDMRTECDEVKTDKQDITVVHGSSSMKSAQ